MGLLRTFARVGVAAAGCVIVPASLTSALTGCGPRDASAERASTTDDGGNGSGASTGDGPVETGWYVEVTADRGIEPLPDRSIGSEYFFPDIMGAGFAVIDADGDGDLDLYLLHGQYERGRSPAAWTPEASFEHPGGANRLLLQEADGRFRDASAGSGADDTGYAQGVAAGDIDSDGDVDLFIANYGHDVLLVNRGDGTFEDRTLEANITGSAWSSSAAMFDYDHDGDLDVYVTRYLAYSPHRPHNRDGSGMIEYFGPLDFDAVVDVLWRNEGDGRFVDVSDASGISKRAGRGLALCVVDLDGDGWQDVFVANDGEVNFAWMNQRDGTFVDRAVEMGLAFNGEGRPESSMGVAIGDVDDDGRSDLFLTHLVRETNTLLLQVADGRYEDRTREAGLWRPSRNTTGFGTAMFDADLDGDLDLAVANGRVIRKAAIAVANISSHWNPYVEPNQLFLNDGSGRFELAGPGIAGAFGADADVSRGLAAVDIDDDGDQDLIVSNGHGSVRLFENRRPRDGSWLVIDAVDAERGGPVEGALVRVEAGGRTYQRFVTRCSSYLYAGDGLVHVGLGSARAVDAVTVHWPSPDGVVIERFEGGPVDRRLVIRRGEGSPAG